MVTKKFVAVLVASALTFAGVDACAKETGRSVSQSIEKYGQRFDGKIAWTYEASKEWWPEAVKPRRGTPNVLLIMLDDVGFAHLGSYGGSIATPYVLVSSKYGGTKKFPFSGKLDKVAVTID